MIRNGLFFTFLALLLVAVVSCSDDDAPGGQLPTGLTILTNGRMLTVKTFPSAILGNSRDIRIYLPASYNGGTATYPVLYLHDGQNVFAPGGPYGCWYVENAYDSLVNQGRLNEAILVAVNNNNDRIPEYTPTADPSYGGGNGEKYVRFLVEEVMPWVASNYRVKTGPTNTAIMGSSLGGLISFYAATTRPQVFGMAGCVSSSFWWDSQKLLSDFEVSSGPAAPVRFWIDSGNAEGGDSDKNGVSSMAEDAIRAAAKLRQLGYVYGQDLLLDIDLPAGHNEAAWAARVHKPLLFFFGKTASVTVTNLALTPSSPEMDAAGTVPEVLLFARAWFTSGISATVPPADLGLNSPQSDLYTVRADGYITLNSGTISGDTNILFEGGFGGQTAFAGVAVYPALSANVALRLQVTAPDTSGSSIYMVGDSAVVGSWNPAGGFLLHLESAGGGMKVYTNTLTLPRNSSLGFKFCAGPAWSYEELNGSGGTIGNRSCTASSSSNWYAAQVLQWKSVP